MLFSHVFHYNDTQQPENKYKILGKEFKLQEIKIQ